MSDDLVKRLRQCSVTKRDQSIKIMDDAADRIEQLEAALAKADRALLEIDSLDPEGKIDGCSQAALRGLVLRMGEIARDARQARDATR